MRAPSVPGIVLAAGASTRLGGGRAKQMVGLDGKSLLRRAAETALGAAGEGALVVVVLGHRAEECARELDGLPVRSVVAEHWSVGMGASLKAGLRAVLEVAPDAVGTVVNLCDQPRVTAEHLRSLARAVDDGSLAVAAEYEGGPGVPAFFRRDAFADIWKLPDHAGAKGLLARFDVNGQLVRVPMPSAALDVDTPEDLARLLGERVPSPQR